MVMSNSILPLWSIRLGSGFWYKFYELELGGHIFVVHCRISK